MDVYFSATKNTRIHRRPDCSLLRTHIKGPVLQADLSKIRVLKFCRQCFPDAPELRVFHARCSTCKQKRPLPCPHNGAVQVYVEQRDGVSARGPEDPQGTLRQVRWVWPENAWRYELVNTLVNPAQAM